MILERMYPENHRVLSIFLFILLVCICSVMQTLDHIHVFSNTHNTFIRKIYSNTINITSQPQTRIGKRPSFNRIFDLISSLYTDTDNSTIVQQAKNTMQIIEHN